MQSSAELQQRFDASAPAFQFAHHYARYAHRDYLVWPDRSQKWRVARLSRGIDDIEQAITRLVSDVQSL